MGRVAQIATTAAKLFVDLVAIYIKGVYGEGFLRRGLRVQRDNLYDCPELVRASLHTDKLVVVFAALLDKISVSSGKYCVITLKYAHLFLVCLVFDGQITIFAIITSKK